jgi:hypothetical protein
MSIIESRRNTGVNHFVVQIGTGYNFEKGTILSVGKRVKLERAEKIKKGQQSVGYYAVPYGFKSAKPGDKIWLVKSEDHQFAFAVADIIGVSDKRMFTDTEMGWIRDGREDRDSDGEGERWSNEVIYTNLTFIRDCQIQIISGQPGNSVVRNYKTSISITADLPAEYDLIQRYRHAHIGL